MSLPQQHDNTPPAEPDLLLTTSEVAALYHVDGKTVARWHSEGKLAGVRVIRTPGGHRRYDAAGIRALMNGDPS